MAPRADTPNSELGICAPAAFIIPAEPAFGACVVVAIVISLRLKMSVVIELDLQPD
jgi:hypothetical protein